MGRQNHVQASTVSKHSNDSSKLLVPAEEGPGALQASKLPQFPVITRHAEAGQGGDQPQPPAIAMNTTEALTQSLMLSLQEQLREHSELVKKLLSVSGPITEAYPVGMHAASTLALSSLQLTQPISSQSSSKTRFHPWVNQKTEKVPLSSGENLDSAPISTSCMPHLVNTVADSVQARTKAWFEDHDVFELEDAEQKHATTWAVCFEQFVVSHYFNSVAMTLIGLNAVLIGWQADQQMQALRKSPSNTPAPSATLDNIENFFSIAFAVELFIRIAALRDRFIFTPDIKWNLLDTLLVVSGLFELFVDSSGKTLSFARVLRVLRMVRVLRIIRMVRFFDSLRNMVGGLMNSLLSLFWLVVLLFIVLFVFAVGCMQAIVQHLEDYNEETASLEQQKQFTDFMTVHGGLLTSMLSLLETISDGTGWHIVMGPVMDISWIYGVATVIFVFFTIFGVMNVVTGIFVDRALYISQLDRNVMIRDEMDRSYLYIRELKDAFSMCDRNGDGTLTKGEVQEMLEKPQIQAMFRTLQLDIGEGQFEQLWDMLDPLETGCIAIDDFVQASLRLKGVATSLDLCAVLLEVSFIRECLEDFRGGMADLFVQIFARLDCLVAPEMKSYFPRSRTAPSIMSARKIPRRFKLPALSNSALISASGMHSAMTLGRPTSSLPQPTSPPRTPSSPKN